RQRAGRWCRLPPPQSPPPLEWVGVATGAGSSVGTSVRLKSGRSAVRPRPCPLREHQAGDSAHSVDQGRGQRHTGRMSHDDALATPWDDVLLWSPPLPLVTALPTLGLTQTASEWVPVPAPRPSDELMQPTRPA